MNAIVMWILKKSSKMGTNDNLRIVQDSTILGIAEELASKNNHCVKQSKGNMHFACFLHKQFKVAGGRF